MDREVAQLPSRRGSAADVAERLALLQRENTSLRAALQERDAQLIAARREAAGFEQRLLRAEAECGSLHESLREAQELLEQSMAGTPWEAQGRQRLEELRRAGRQDAVEVASLYERLKHAQEQELRSAEQVAALRRSLDDAQRELALRRVDPGQEQPPQEPADQATYAADLVAARTQVAALQDALNGCRAQLAERQKEIYMLTQSAHPAQLSPPRRQSAPRSAASPSSPPPRPLAPDSHADPDDLRRMLTDALHDLAGAREQLAELEAQRLLAEPLPPELLEGADADRELLGPSWDTAFATGDAERLPLYRARLRQALSDLIAVRDELRRGREEKGRLTRELARERGRSTGAAEGSVPRSALAPQSPQLQQALRDLAETRAEAARLRDEKGRLLAAVRAASAQRRLQQEEDDERRRRRRIAVRRASLASEASRPETPGEPGFDIATDTDASSAELVRTQIAELQRFRDRCIQLSAEAQSVRDEKDKVAQQLVAALAAAQAAETLRAEALQQRAAALGELEAARSREAELQQRLAVASERPPLVDRSCSAESLIVAAPSAQTMDVRAEAAEDEARAQRQADEFVCEQLRHLLQQTQQLLERSDAQLLTERDKLRARNEEVEELRAGMELAAREAADLQHEHEALIVERDQWMQAARDSDTARLQMVEHVEQLQARGGSPRRVRARDGSQEVAPDAAELLREKAELLVQIDLLKERLGDSQEELEGARRELIAGLESRSELHEEQGRCGELSRALRAAQLERDRAVSEQEETQQTVAELRQQLENAALVKKCSGERYEAMLRDVEDIKQENSRLRRELEAQMKEIAFLCDTLTETSSQFEDSSQRLEQIEAERAMLLAEKHKDVQRIEELGSKLTQVRLQNDMEAVEERKQLQQEREFDSLMYSDRMRELEEAREETARVKARATRAINVLKSSLQNALTHMKTLGDDFETERRELQERLLALDRQGREKAAECDRLQAELAALQKRESGDGLKEKAAKLSRAYERAKEKFHEQGQVLERTKEELKKARKDAQESRRLRELLDEAAAEQEQLNRRLKEQGRELKEMRSRLELAGHKETTKTRRQDDEVAHALRDQLAAAQRDLKKEKDLRLRLAEDQGRMRRQSAEGAAASRKALEDLKQQLQEAEKRAAEQRDRMRAELQQARGQAADAGGSDKLKFRCAQLEALLDERESEVEALSTSMAAKDCAVGELRDGLASCRSELNALSGALCRIEGLARGYAPMAFVSQSPPAEGYGEASGRSRTDLADAALFAAKTALEHLQRMVEQNAVSGQEDLGRLQAEQEAARAELLERLRCVEAELRRADETSGALQDELQRAQRDVEKLRKDCQKYREAAEGLRRQCDALRRELRDTREMRDRLQKELREAAASAEAAKEAHRKAAHAAEQAAADAQRARAELKAALAGRDQAQVRELQKELASVREQLRAAERARDEAQAALRSSGSAEDEAGRLRAQLRDAGAELGHLRPAAAEAAAIAKSYADAQTQLAECRDALERAEADAQRGRDGLQGDLERAVARAIEEQRRGFDDELRELQQEADRLRADLRTAEEAAHQLRQQLADQASRAAGEQDALREQLAANGGDLDAATQQLADAAQELRARDAELHALRARLADAEAAAAHGAAHSSDLEAELLRVRAELTETRRELDEGRELMLSLVGPPADGSGSLSPPR
eukprot:TRINITY_DN8204_c0_g2_i2.p1 TRINITY_DN8204_c0_g2~~TRINITY_DN8204_c0_g2_i2.p1  ORF type:complete len:1716 (+),score=727.85 TRINITY_DN8204_c0_g2_i2:82-5148(+)